MLFEGGGGDCTPLFQTRTCHWRATLLASSFYNSALPLPPRTKAIPRRRRRRRERALRAFSTRHSVSLHTGGLRVVLLAVVVVVILFHPLSNVGHPVGKGNYPPSYGQIYFLSLSLFSPCSRLCTRNFKPLIALSSKFTGESKRSLFRSFYLVGTLTIRYSWARSSQFSKSNDCAFEILFDCHRPIENMKENTASWRGRRHRSCNLLFISSRKNRVSGIRVRRFCFIIRLANAA